MYDKFKYILSDDGFFYGMLIFLVALSSFGLGRLSGASPALKTEHPGVVMTQMAEYERPLSTSTISVQEPMYVASQNGSKFHLLTCPGAQQIKEENKIFFSTKEEAQAQGFTPAGNCKGI